MKNFLSIIGQLVRADLKAFKSNALSEIIDLLIWVFVVTIINGYLLPLFNVPIEFILLSFSGTIASGVSFRTFPNIYGLVSDLNGERMIAQKLILPLPSWMIFLAMAGTHFLTAIFVCIWVLPFGKIILWQLFPTANISLWRFFIILLSSALFFSVFSLFVASFVKGMDKIGKVFIRFLFPLWFFGGFQYTWQKLYEASPKLAMINLINPYIYTMEGTRTALLGPRGNIPFWLCAVMLILFAAIALWYAISRFKKQLDFV